MVNEKLIGKNIHGGASGLIASSVSAYFPGPASFTAATLNSYGFPSTKPFTVNSVSGISPMLHLGEDE